jgi:hypothetical protein
MRQQIFTAITGFSIIAALLFGGHVSAKQQPSTVKQQTPAKESPATNQHMHDMNERGKSAMGFSQSKTTHHFLISKTGGAIQVEANTLGDTATRDLVRQHLRHIALKFADGDFDIPFAVHNQQPAGVNGMRRLKNQITYSFEETKLGGRVRIRSSNAEAIAAVHDFLRFQIDEHQTSDALEIR